MRTADPDLHYIYGANASTSLRFIGCCRTSPSIRGTVFGVHSSHSSVHRASEQGIRVFLVSAEPKAAVALLGETTSAVAEHESGRRKS
jgi:hypothetical protein